MKKIFTFIGLLLIFVGSCMGEENKIVHCIIMIGTGTILLVVTGVFEHKPLKEK